MSYLKLIVLLYILNSVNCVKLPGWTPKAEAAANKCITKTKIAPAIVVRAYTRMDFPQDKNFKCFVKCTFVETGGMTESGQLLLENLRKEQPPKGLTKTQYGKAVDACVNAKGEDACDVAFNYNQCFTGELVKSFMG